MGGYLAWFAAFSLGQLSGALDNVIFQVRKGSFERVNIESHFTGIGGTGYKVRKSIVQLETRQGR